VGEGIRGRFRSKRARRAAVTQSLADLGFEPQQAGADELVLRNCAFADLTASHRDLVCGMNAALVAGVLDGAELTSLHAEGGPSRPPAACGSAGVEAGSVASPLTGPARVERKRP
jgi:predicted ArsR family transcriptional regulator